MKERLFQYIWQFQYYNTTSLYTASGEPLVILNKGTYNTNQGPDFLLATIRAGTTTWAGNIELHVNSSDWNSHQHSADENYQNIILHVVWNNDVVIRDRFGQPLPTLDLRGRVSKFLLNRYEELMNAGYFIPCNNQISSVNELTVSHWKERLIITRLQKRALAAFEHLSQNHYHWEDLFWRMLAKSFGGTINGESFERIAAALPLTLMAKHRNQVIQIEAMLFGQAGLLNGVAADDYQTMLQKEFRFLQKKYSLTEPGVAMFFLRMRPANFPTVRLAQLAMLIHTSHHLFSTIKESDDLSEVKKLLKVTANDYWHYHYTFGEMSAFSKKMVGSQMVDNLLINTIVPILYAYGVHYSNLVYQNKAIGWLEKLAPEKNALTRGFQKLKVSISNAADSQALIELKNEYCNHRRCLECAVGNSVLRSFT